MPPRKSDVSKAATGDEGTPAKETPVRDGINVEDLNLPKSIVTRLAKGVLPPNTQIQGNAMLAMTKSATVFVNYLASHANENAQSQGRKTINPQDVFKALEDLEFPDFRPRLEAELTKFNEVQADKRNTYRKKVAADKGAGKSEPGEGEGEDGDTTLEHDADGIDREGEPVAKKARREAGDGDVVGEEEGDGEREDEEDEEANGNGDETEEEEGEQEGAERPDDEERPDEEEDEADEALDNGEDSD